MDPRNAIGCDMFLNRYSMAVVLLCFIFADKSAPDSSNLLIHSRCPFWHAKCNGVQPCTSLVFTIFGDSANESRRSTTSWWPWAAARWRGEQFVWKSMFVLMFMSQPAAIISLAQRTWPCWQARWRGVMPRQSVWLNMGSLLCWSRLINSSSTWKAPVCAAVCITVILSVRVGLRRAPASSNSFTQAALRPYTDLNIGVSPCTSPTFSTWNKNNVSSGRAPGWKSGGPKFESRFWFKVFLLRSYKNNV